MRVFPIPAQSHYIYIYTTLKVSRRREFFFFFLFSSPPRYPIYRRITLLPATLPYYRRLTLTSTFPTHIHLIPFVGTQGGEQVHYTSVPGRAKPTCGTFWSKRWRTPTAYSDESEQEKLSPRLQSLTRTTAQAKKHSLYNFPNLGRGGVLESGVLGNCWYILIFSEPSLYIALYIEVPA